MLPRPSSGCGCVFLPGYAAQLAVYIFRCVYAKWFEFLCDVWRFLSARLLLYKSSAAMGSVTLWGALLPLVLAFAGFRRLFLCHKIKFSFSHKLNFKRNSSHADAAFLSIATHQHWCYLPFKGGWVGGAPRLCWFCGEANPRAAVSPSPRPQHLIKRSKFSDEDATRMWSLLPRSRTVSVPVPSTVPTWASPLPSSHRNPTTIRQVLQTQFVRLFLRSNSLHSAPLRPSMEKLQRVRCADMNIGHRLHTDLSFYLSLSYCFL